MNEELCIYFYYRSFILYIISMILYSITLFIVEGVGGRVVSTCTSWSEADGRANVYFVVHVQTSIGRLKL